MDHKSITPPSQKPGKTIDITTFAPEVKTGFAARPATALHIQSGRQTHIAVVGAGVFGCWTALQLQRQGIKVTLTDAWGPGNSRSSSGDETRVIRCIYGDNRMYFELTARALELWQDFEKQCGKQLLYKTGALWFAHQPVVDLIETALPMMQQKGFSYEKYTLTEAATMYPQVNYDGLDHVFLEKEAGYLKARESCQAVVEMFIKEGGTYLPQSAQPGPVTNLRMQHIRLSGGTILQADAYIYACGSWLRQLFPDLMGDMITPERQEVYYFGTPASHTALFDQLPVWIDWNMHAAVYYGIPASTHRGFKVACDSAGGEEPFDPTHHDRIINMEKLAQARQFMQYRFPLLADAPLAESRVCHYPNSPDGNFIIDTHPGAANVWLLGGGSGHGFKQGPAFGEMAARVILGETPLPLLFALSRFHN